MRGMGGAPENGAIVIGPPSGGVPAGGAGRVAGRVNALTLVVPLKVGTSALLGAWLVALRRAPGPLRHRAVRNLDQLRFVSAIRWSVLPPFQTARGNPFKRPADQRWQLLFESNFDGDTVANTSM